MELLDAHGQAMTVFDRTTHAITDDEWDAPTPCTEWSVRDLLNHLVSEQLWVPSLLDGATIEEVGDRFDGDQLGSDPIGRWTETARQARAAWTAPGVLDRRVHLSFGTTTATEYGWQMTLDLAVHGWDLAVAVGRPDGIGADLAKTLLEVFEDQVERWNGLGIFDPPVPVPIDAPPRTRLIALVGRRPVTV